MRSGDNDIYDYHFLRWWAPGGAEILSLSNYASPMPEEKVQCIHSEVDNDNFEEYVDMDDHQLWMLSN